MNAKKHKHKNRPKPNPEKPVEAKSDVKVEEKSDVPEKCEPEVIKDVGEVINVPENVTENVAEAKKEPEDVKKGDSKEEPTKPKRNKNKKKKQDDKFDQEIDEPQADSQTQPAAIEVVESVKPVKSETEDKNVIEKELIGVMDNTVTPSARKKKNKKKNQDKVAEDTPKDNIPQEIIVPAEPIQQLDTEVKELFDAPPEIKQEGKKKKNKKKKRNDSERSDKSEDVKACTSAFQELLTEDDKKDNEPCKDKDENTMIAAENITEQSTQPTVKVTEGKTNVDETEQTIIPAPLEEEIKDETSSKKKNKKDRKHLQKEQQQAQEAAKVESLLMPDEAALSAHVQREPSPKPKAKIAKPVEKKRKDKINQPETTESIDTKKEEVSDANIEHIQREPEVKPAADEKLITDIIEPIILGQKDIKTENISVPEESRKKRKKSPKPPKNEHKEGKPTETSIKTDKPKTEPVQSESKINEPSQTAIMTEDTPKSQEQISESEIKQPEDLKFEEVGGKGKKKKKTPKVPTEIATDINMPEFSEMKEQTDVPKESKEKPEVEKPETMGFEEKDIPTIDIEVRSLRADESEGSSYDITPDVHFQRSSSQQLLDDNNNAMLIQEVTSIEDVKLTEQSRPLVEGSGSTPLGTPDLISSGIKIEEIKSDEKETVKSKMMDVNRGMEELRLSIERSLAEFSAMEKKEEQIEKDFEEKSKSQEITPVKAELRQEALPLETQESRPIPVKEEQQTAEKCKPPENITEQGPSKKDKKGKSKKKGKPEPPSSASSTTTQTTTQEQKPKEEKDTHKGDDKDKKSSENKGKQKSTGPTEDKQQTQAKDSENIDMDSNDMKKPTDASLKSDTTLSDSLEQLDYEPIENFEDALTSSMDDVNKTFELIAKDAETENKTIQKELAANKPEINVTSPEDTAKKEDKNKSEKVNPLSQPKNLLGHPDIPVQSNRIDYKKEKNKTPNEITAKVKIKDSQDIEKISKESQTESKKIVKKQTSKDSFSQIVKDNGDYVYKYSFRKVFLQSACHICKKSLLQTRVPCGYCNLVFYCSNKHKDEDYAEHQALCFAVSTIVHLKDQKHIYADAKTVIGQDYRILRMQIIVSCEKVLKRRLVPWEQEALLYPRLCADVACREWRQGKLKDCEGCGQLSYCLDHPEHLPKSHHRWCKSYALYSKLVCYQQTKGRLEPKLPTKVMMKYELPAKINEVLASMYEEKIDMSDIQYAALTQIATAPLTAVYCHHLYIHKKNLTNLISNGNCKHMSRPEPRRWSSEDTDILENPPSQQCTFVIHVVGAELQFEADALNKWEVFFLHLRPDVEHLKVVLISPVLNPGNLPLDLLGKIRSCENCINNNRRVTFSFQDRGYPEYRNSEEFINPDLICAYNPSIQRSSAYNVKDPWPVTINTILKLKTPFIITAYTIPELRKDIAKIKEFSELDFNVITEPILNNFASVRPDRNFITDDEMPLLFKNYCVSLICGC